MQGQAGRCYSHRTAFSLEILQELGQYPSKRMGGKNERKRIAMIVLEKVTTAGFGSASVCVTWSNSKAAKSTVGDLAVVYKLQIAISMVCKVCVLRCL